MCAVDDYKDDDDNVDDDDNDDKDDDDGEKPKNDERSKFVFFFRGGTKIEQNRRTHFPELLPSRRFWEAGAQTRGAMGALYGKLLKLGAWNKGGKLPR